MLDNKVTFSAHVEYTRNTAIPRLKMLGKTCSLVVGRDMSLQLYEALKPQSLNMGQQSMTALV